MSATAQHTAQYAEYDAWRFHLGAVDTLSGAFCVASTRSGWVTLSLAVSADQGNGAELYTLFADPRWNHDGGQQVFELAFDDFTWRMPGWGVGSLVLVHWRDSDRFREFMEDIAGKAQASLSDDTGALLADFSLQGSRSATTDLEYCVEDLGDGGFVSNPQSVKSN